ncbi:hypothetical protein NC653_037123 [Populus alba x Populus x berolinensis]|uniref:Uncharacterized protein n=1 Tax=Populus alba x Populus x berolinensis TaxID=444605 RepID=A0AAD6LLW5_9ROSI|nr:hypothetical protein NC653_037123 [Populus alba x Populus x berolinensis]
MEKKTVGDKGLFTSALRCYASLCHASCSGTAPCI